jgi:hypothetical protein
MRESLYNVLDWSCWMSMLGRDEFWLMRELRISLYGVSTLFECMRWRSFRESTRLVSARLSRTSIVS